MPDLKTLADDLVDHHRRNMTPYAVLERTARTRRIRRRFGAVGGVAAATAILVLAVVGLSASSHRQAVVVNPAPFPSTPPGWNRVNYNNASVAAPANWDLILQNEFLCPTPQYGVLIDNGQSTEWDARPGTVITNHCGNVIVVPPTKAYVRLQALTTPPPAGTPVEINGHSGVETMPSAGTEIYYFPDLSLKLTLFGSQAAPISNTVGWSAAYLLLHPSRPVKVPSNWKQVRYQNVTLRVPPSWPVQTLSPSDHEPNNGGTFTEFTTPIVDEGLGTQTNLGAFPPPAVDGVWLHPYPFVLYDQLQLSRQRPGWPGNALPPGSTTLRSKPTTLILLPVPNDGEQAVQLVAGDGAGNRVAIDIGLGPDPLIAQQVVASIR